MCFLSFDSYNIEPVCPAEEQQGRSGLLEVTWLAVERVRTWSWQSVADAASLDQCFSKYHPQTWNPVRNAHSWVPPEVCWVNPLGRAQHLCVNSLQVFLRHPQVQGPLAHTLLFGRVQASLEASPRAGRGLFRACNTLGQALHLQLVHLTLLQNRTGRGWGLLNNILLPKGCPLFLQGPPSLSSLCPPPEERQLSILEIGEKERNYLFKNYADLE